MSISNLAHKGCALTLAATCLLAPPSRADERLTPVVVSATRSEQPLTDVVADVSIIDREVIERNAGGSVADVLAKEAGVQIMRQGGVASNTELYMRGADTRFTAVFVDGIRLDSQSLSGGASWSAIPLSQIDRIEILRGPAAAVYGSDAVAGVIQIFTRAGESGFKPSLLVGRGTYQTDFYEASATGGNDTFDYSLGMQNDRSKGFNVRRGNNPDADGYKRESTYARLGTKIGPNNRVDFTLLSADFTNDYDSSPSKQDLDRRQISTVGTSWSWRRDPSYKSTVHASQSTDKDDTTANGAVATSAKTLTHNYLWINEFKLDRHRFHMAWESREDQFSNLSTASPRKFFEKDRNQIGVALGYGLKIQKHTVQLNIRRDRESQFGNQSTHNAAYAYELNAAWRATASTGTAFRAPTLYQRFHPSYGNNNLLPELSNTREVGLKYKQGVNSAGVQVYRTQIENMIYFDQNPAVYKYASTAEAMLEGITFTAATTVGRYNLHGSYDVQKPRDLQTGNWLTRRSANIARLAVDTTVASWRTGVETQLFDRRYNDAANTVRLGGYGLINLYANRPLDKDLSLWLRVDNLTNRYYELSQNYYPPGTTVFVSLRWAPH